MTEPASTVPEKWVADDGHWYTGVKGSPYATEATVFALSPNETVALTKRFQSTASPAVNGVMIKAPPFTVINALAEFGYRVICSSGDAEILWTLERET